MGKINISEITDTHIKFMKKNNLLKKNNFNLNNFDKLLNNINNIYQQKINITVNNSLDYNQEKINLIYYQKIEKNIQSNYLPKTIKIIKYLFENEKQYFDLIINNTKITNEKKKKFINFFYF